ncbi:diaminopropionate ammonia-lyase [Streptomyces acidiscabies]|uniref:Diaminopropionate ammonia-lyase n=1 Tax=Streptomyces acidiscabies TaxID=42234 RepID=A0A0L0K6S5_9ACTN|nr:diaminopropionate ammonia-lyase [Streptomyces acidiscabies]
MAGTSLVLVGYRRLQGVPACHDRWVLDPENVTEIPWLARPAARTWRCPPPPTAVRAFHRTLPDYAPTPLTELPTLARELNLGRVFVKDESSRLGLPAFKALGATWAIHRALADAPHTTTLVTATDGNHGRAVARTARQLGMQAHVFIPQGVDPAPIAAEGAKVTEVDGDYDTAVRHAAETPDALLIQDTAWPGYEEIPAWIVEGYDTLCAEIDEQLPAEPDLIVVPVGVGSLAQAVITHYRSRPNAPALMSVEPDSAACVLESLRHGEPVSVTTGRTTMAGLNCGTPSSIAWPYLHGGLDAAIAVTDEASARAAAELAALGVDSGPCGAAPLAGLRAARHLLPDLGPDSVAVLLNTEGAHR